MDDLTLVAPAEPVAAPVSAKEQLRAFEDNVFGKNVGRINGEVEHGVGSPFSAMTSHQSAHYAALQKMVAAEQGMADAAVAMAAAEAAHAAASMAASNAAKASDETA